MKNTNLKLLVLALVGLFLTNCQRDEVETTPKKEIVTTNATDDLASAVSINEAKTLFENAETQKQTSNASARSSKLFIELVPYWENFSQGKTPLENVYASVPITVVGTDVNAEVLFLKENGTTKQYLFVTDIDSLATDKQIINADYYLFDTKGYFISAFRMTDGLISHRLVPKKKGTYRWVHNPEKMQTSMSWGLYKGNSTGRGRRNLTDIEMDEPSTMYGKEPIELEAVTVYGRRLYIPPIYFIPNYFVYPSYDREDSYRNKEFDTGGGGGDSYSGNSKKGSSDIGADLTKVKMDGGDNIINELENPCAKALVDKAPTLANDIATLLNKTFGTNNNINITFYNKSFGNVTEAAKTYSQGSTDKNGDTFSCDVYLNDDVIKGASQEYILATIYHEVVHAFLRYEHLTLGEKAFNQKYPSVYSKEFFVGNKKQKKMYILIDDKQDHNKFSNFIESLAQSIMSLPGTEISLETARAMAKVGVVENESLSERENYLNTQQKLGKSGITCTPKTP
ncbi:hypothetical protein JMN10_02330 [Capnocytophaga genosp. AHN8471]|uniref:Lipoprotein n=1 Tax=Capnocytophaga genosp. AHN8471 TaxID=327574 RepID=A0ABS1YVG4_9FLAO|nr:hypothetical protein [Capnocytophaga genosp. AHN8471]MBM0650412.1 hypothetical protein [Capnocytophaga genosp. AHN8471]MBM0661024.1 hypothetical protein [Capnocytophaga genosp. AHN8471]